MGKVVNCPLCGGPTYLYFKQGVLPQLRCSVHEETVLLRGRRPLVRVKDLNHWEER